MRLLSCAGLCRGFDSGVVFDDLGFELHRGERVGLVGPNGVGKTTLLRILAGVDPPDRGRVELHAGARIALLEQQPTWVRGRSLIEEARTALAPLVEAQQELVRTAEELASATDPSRRQQLSERYDQLNELLRHHDAYHLDHHVEMVLDGLGFERCDYDRPVETFSGGQLNRLMLARLLLSAPDIMLLDEPNNHLDVAATRWLEDYLAQQTNAMLIVSHDRVFLDRVVTKVFELFRGRLTCYVGNYQAYVRQRRERYEVQLKTWQAQQAYIARQEEYIRRVHYGQLHKQAQSRRAALERLERVERPVAIEGPRMHFVSVRRSGDVVLEADNLAKSYDRPLFSNLSFQLLRGKRLGIVGPNGSGKTTLLRILLRQEPPDRGTVRHGHHVDILYYDQHLQSIAPDTPAIRAVWPDDPDADEQSVRDLLARFGITGDRVYQDFGTMSGGEKSRVALARLVARRANLLVLDEPTNHLDLWARESLEDALADFDGTLIVVSHDRYFLNRVVDLLIVLDGRGEAQVIHGNYETYERRLREEPVEATSPRRPSEPARGTRPPSGTSRRRRKFPFRKVADIEADIHQLETRLQELEQLLASPELYRDGERVKQVTAEFEDAKKRLPLLYEHWEEAIELNPAE